MRNLLFGLFILLLLSAPALAVEEGEKAPDFKLVMQNMQPFTLSENINNTLVLAFVPAAFTGVCTNEFCAFRDMHSELTNLDAYVVGITCDAPFSNNAWAQENQLNFPVLSDYNREVVKKYNVYHENFANLEGYTIPKRSIFIVNSDGIIAYKWVSDNPGVEPPYDKIKEAIKKINGEGK